MSKSKGKQRASSSAPSPNQDHLTALPTELIHEVISYLFPTHDPDLAFHTPAPPLRNTHTLDLLAATCKTLRFEVNDWAHHFLLSHAEIIKFKELKSVPARDKTTFGPNYLRATRGKRKGLLTWAEKNCAFCGKGSERRAILMNGLRCCVECDKANWPSKITKTDAMKKYDLKSHHLLPHHHPSSPHLGRLLSLHPGLPRLRYGTYTVYGVTTTMFLTSSVRSLAAMVHGGDLQKHLKRREAERVARRETMKENAAKRAEESEKEKGRVIAESARGAKEAQRRAGEAAMRREGHVIVIDSDDEDDEEVKVVREVVELSDGEDEDESGERMLYGPHIMDQFSKEIIDLSD